MTCGRIGATRHSTTVGLRPILPRQISVTRDGARETVPFRPLVPTRGCASWSQGTAAVTKFSLFNLLTETAVYGEIKSNPSSESAIPLKKSKKCKGWPICLKA